MLSARHQQYFLFAQAVAPNPLPVPARVPAVVVESGPVVYDDAAADEEDEEEEEMCVSAMDLLGGNGQCFYKKVNPFKKSKNTTVKQHITAFMRANFNIYLHFIVF